MEKQGAYRERKRSIGPVRAAFFDVDGTLLSHRTARIPESALRALFKLHRQGVLLFLATGRHVKEIGVVEGLASLPWDGQVTLDGQYCLDREGVYFSRALEMEDIERLISCTRRMDIPCMFVEEQEMYISRSNDTVRGVLKDLHVALPPAGELERGLDHPVYLAVTYCSASLQLALMKELTHARSAQWHSHGFDIFHSDGGKDVGIIRTCERFHILPEETIAFGDSENDLDMLRCAGVGVAMGNASPEVKAAADYITADIDEDGIERALCDLGVLV